MAGPYGAWSGRRRQLYYVVEGGRPPGVHVSPVSQSTCLSATRCRSISTTPKTIGSANRRGPFEVAPKGNLGRNWAVQMAPDEDGKPGAWSDVPGTAKTRTITGASGSRVWVRFAMVRGMEVSAWGTAVLVTIP